MQAELLPLLHRHLLLPCLERLGLSAGGSAAQLVRGMQLDLLLLCTQAAELQQQLAQGRGRSAGSPLTEPLSSVQLRAQWIDLGYLLPAWELQQQEGAKKHAQLKLLVALGSAMDCRWVADCRLFGMTSVSGKLPSPFLDCPPVRRRLVLVGFLRQVWFSGQCAVCEPLHAMNP